LLLASQGNRIMARGLTAISLNLGKSESLVQLDLSDNSILSDIHAVNAFCEALRTNVSLETVDFEHNVVGAEATALIAETLQMCPNIKSFKACGQGVMNELFKTTLKDSKGGKKGKKKKK